MNDSVIIITGASRGLGSVIARDLASDKPGRPLVLTARDGDRLESLAAELRSSGARVTVVAADISVAADRERVLAAARAIGPIEVLINNAGLEIPKAVVDQTPEDIDRQIAINLLAPIHLTRALLPELIAQRRGVVVMISSMSGKSPTPYNAIYSATKFGLNGFTASLRIELDGTGVHAGVVCPSFVAEAGMWADSGGRAPAMMREVPTRAVAEGVRRVMAGAAEVLVTPTPVRPVLALAQLFPSLDRIVLRRTGVLSAMRDRARRPGST